MRSKSSTESASAPLLAFSHGNAGFRFQSTFLTTHLASYGYIIIAPDHTGNTFFEFFRLKKAEDIIKNLMESANNRPDDMKFVIDQILDEKTGAGSVFSSMIDPENIGLGGHSFGGWTTITTASQEDRLKLLPGVFQYAAD